MRGNLQVWAILAGLGTFALIAADVTYGGLLTRTDAAIEEQVALWRGDAPLPDVGRILSVPGDAWVQVVAGIAALIGFGMQRMWWRAGAATALAVGVPVASTLLKQAFARLRPPGSISESFAFPSGHVLAATAILGGILLLAAQAHAQRRPMAAPRTWRMVLAVWVALAAITASGRILMGVHWLSDTLASAALGTAFVASALWAVPLLEARWPIHPPPAKH